MISHPAIRLVRKSNAIVTKGKGFVVPPDFQNKYSARWYNWFLQFANGRPVEWYDIVDNDDERVSADAKKVVRITDDRSLKMILDRVMANYEKAGMKKPTLSLVASGSSSQKVSNKYEDVYIDRLHTFEVDT